MATDVPPFTIGTRCCLFLYVYVLTLTCATYLTVRLCVCLCLPLRLPLDAPKYDQSTYFGRWRQFVELVSPRCVRSGHSHMHIPQLHY